MVALLHIRLGLIYGFISQCSTETVKIGHCLPHLVQICGGCTITMAHIPLWKTLHFIILFPENLRGGYVASPLQHSCDKCEANLNAAMKEMVLTRFFPHPKETPLNLLPL